MCRAARVIQEWCKCVHLHGWDDGKTKLDKLLTRHIAEQFSLAASDKDFSPGTCTFRVIKINFKSTDRFNLIYCLLYCLENISSTQFKLVLLITIIEMKWEYSLFLIRDLK